MPIWCGLQTLKVAKRTQSLGLSTALNKFSAILLMLLPGKSTEMHMFIAWKVGEVLHRMGLESRN